MRLKVANIGASLTSMCRLFQKLGPYPILVSILGIPSSDHASLYHYGATGTKILLGQYYTVRIFLGYQNSDEGICIHVDREDPNLCACH